MNLGRLFYVTNLWLILSCALGLLIFASEIGWRIGLRCSEAEKLHRQVSYIATAVLALLGLLLAFTFSMANARYDHRKQVILTEANAIGTAWLRADLLDEPLRGEMKKTLLDYTDARIALYETGADAPRLKAAAERSESLQRVIWKMVDRVARQDRRPGVVFGVMSAVNDVIDMHETRIAAIENYIPAGLILMLIVFAALALYLVGWTAGLTRCRSQASTFIFAILVIMVLGVIMDINRPQRGLIQTGQNSMLRLQEGLHSASAK